MHKIATLLIVFFGFTFSSGAQTTNCELVPGFTATLTAPNTYHFLNTSIGLSSTDSIRWTFGDGTASNQVSPGHTYAQPGQYNVCIRIQKRNSAGTLSNCIREICHSVTIGTINNCEMIASFSATRTAPNTFHFQNTSLGFSPNDSIKWTFGDGTASNQVNPTHTYAHSGQYTVCIRIQKRNPNGILTNCVREFCRIVVVEIPANCELTAAFTATLTGVNTYHFQNTSVGLSPTDSIKWTFGDGTFSNQVSPTHTYAQPGQYNVCIRIQKRNTLGGVSNCVKELCRLITVGTTINCELVAGFTATPTGPNTFQFNNTSLGLSPNDTIKWTFGDGTTSNQVSPTHTYAHPGQYNVCIRIQKRNPNGVLTNCVREFCHLIIVGTSTSCELTAAFTATPISPNSYHFQNTSVGLLPNDSIRWTFGDGTSSNQVNPNHTYAQPGRYNVCLRIHRRSAGSSVPNCVKEVCHVIEPSSNTSCALPYPNPAANHVNVQVSLLQNQMIHVFIYNASNLLVKEKHQQGYSGGNIVNVLIGDLMPGVYSMKVIHENVVCITSFIKL